MSAAWTAEQRTCLAALGYTLYRPVASAATAIEPVRMDDAEGPLARAVLRAAGMDPAAIADPASWWRAQGIAQPSQLRNDPAAKRALWPRLRALRCGRKPP
jgi:hypothetical protein